MCWSLTSTTWLFCAWHNNWCNLGKWWRWLRKSEDKTGYAEYNVDQECKEYGSTEDWGLQQGQSDGLTGAIVAFGVRAKDRADFVVINGDSKCFEIKSKVDTLRRLDKQSADYHHVFEYNTVVVDGKHLLVFFSNSIPLRLWKWTRRHVRQTICRTMMSVGNAQSRQKYERMT